MLVRGDCDTTSVGVTGVVGEHEVGELNRFDWSARRLTLGGRRDQGVGARGTHDVSSDGEPSIRPLAPVVCQ